MLQTNLTPFCLFLSADWADMETALYLIQKNIKVKLSCQISKSQAFFLSSDVSDSKILITAAIGARVHMQ